MTSGVMYPTLDVSNRHQTCGPDNGCVDPTSDVRVGCGVPTSDEGICLLSLLFFFNSEGIDFDHARMLLFFPHIVLHVQRLLH